MHEGVKVPREGEQQSPAELLLLAAACCCPHLDVENVGDHAKRGVNVQEESIQRCLSSIERHPTSHYDDFGPFRLPQAQNL